MGDVAAHQLANYLKNARHALAELHLSHNQIRRDGAAALLHAAAAAADREGLPRYPSEETLGTGRHVPLWLRLEYNLVADGQELQEEMERELLQVRRSRAFLKGRMAPMICEAQEGCGCNSRQCSLLCPGGVGDRPGGPVVHAPHLRRQQFPGRAGPRPAFNFAAPGAEPPAAVLRAPVMPRARSPVGRPCAADDAEKEERAAPQARPRREGGDGDEAEPAPTLRQAPASGAIEDAASLAEAAVPAAVDTAKGCDEHAADASPVEVGQVLRITRAVTVNDALASGFAPENYLSPLVPGDQVEVVHVEAGWLWATKFGASSQGWLSLDAVRARGGA